jgi:hypothetical protein
MQIGILVLASPVVANGALHQHAKLHRRGHSVTQRAVEVNVVTVTELLTVTVDPVIASAITSVAEIKSMSASSAPVIVLNPVSPSSPATNSSQPTSVVSEPPASPTTNDKGVKPYLTLVPVANSAVVKNSCAYPVYIWSEGNPSCAGPATKCKLIEANGTHVEQLRRCSDGGIALKVSKDKNAAKPMQFEYSVWHDDKTISYDISYLDCMNNANNEKDVSECAGVESGIQAVGGGDCKDFHCPGDEWCAKQAYVVAEFGYLPGAPVGGCTVDKGIAFELCAGKRT